MSEFKADSIPMVHSDNWFDSINVDAIGDDARRSILEFVKNKLGFSKTCEVLDIAKSSLHRYLSGEKDSCRCC